MKTITLKLFLIIIITILNSNSGLSQCIDPTNIYSFIYNEKTYEIIKENKSWIDAASCAVERGGILAEINDAMEQTAIYNELNANANINTNNTVAPDGGGGSYVWLGGNDLQTEGNWVWDGNNDNNSVQFWMGDRTGNPVGGLYNNWGNEPDDFAGQDALGLSLNGWPLGFPGHWNDVDHTNSLYFIVEHPTILGTDEFEIYSMIKIFPNPVIDYLSIEVNTLKLKNIRVFNALGSQVIHININEYSKTKQIDFTTIKSGLYFLIIETIDGQTMIKKILK